ncbi:Dual specificity protein phosphatase CDC14A [Tritrichomonas foetus]|uniref:Dual specificity protein phosphatase CDC14A n=1 Tax=Tritrichomonas foetus TaxID=1144522 RepID=A0A1J4KQK0_9EUKA|nr:Dual specificity protein phosphatase CDC14A [Tritrichomonas foetus]|eukprot:OHT11966.1 Dual specificity protein phosphatase CDC14A [Tritrichomonas foetus]
MSLIKPDLGIMIIPGKLFLHCFHKKPADSICDHYFMFDDIKLINFEPISRENGPPNLPQITAFITLLRDKLTRINKQIHICCSLGSESRVNCIYLLCVFILLERECVQSLISQQVNKVYPSKYSKAKTRTLPDYDHPLTIFSGIYPPIEEYQDATASPFTMSISDALSGFMKAVNLGWYNFRRFDTETYNFYLAPENGFMTWVVPNRLLVLSSPGIADSPLLFDMLPLFRKWRIKIVVSFATEARGFEDLARVGIDRLNLDCASDSLPTTSDVMKFIEVCDRGGAVAICSLNGLGRGPMFAAIWLVHSFGFSPKEAIGWVRAVRQGAIYGVQQDFIVRMDRSFHPQVAQATIIEKALQPLPQNRKKAINNKFKGRPKLRTLKLTYA